MKSLLRLASAFLLLSLLSTLSYAASASEPELKAVDTGKCLLWSGTAPSGGRVWLLGAIHLGKAPFWPFDKAIEKAWSDASALAVELDMNDKSVTGEAAKLMIEKSMIPDAQPSLSQLLGENDAKRLDDILRKDYHCSVKTVERMRPWSLNMMLSLMSCQKAGWREDYGIDRHFSSLAVDLKRPILSLETPDVQVGALSGVPDKDMLSVLMESVETPSEGLGEIEMLVDCWKYGDASTMVKFIEANGAKHPGFIKAVLTARNSGMASKIKTLTSKSDDALFVVVGSAHLVGDDGVVSLLKKEGYKLEQAKREGVN